MNWGKESVGWIGLAIYWVLMTTAIIIMMRLIVLTIIKDLCFNHANNHNNKHLLGLIFFSRSLPLFASSFTIKYTTAPLANKCFAVHFFPPLPRPPPSFCVWLAVSIRAQIPLPWNSYGLIVRCSLLSRCRRTGAERLQAAGLALLSSSHQSCSSRIRCCSIAIAIESN